eukprot:GHRR01030989.1.p1 GENE.GHRR01030989.1~~GHRR01030989.1.p1  ORF type:complete len:247 (+),score=89.89 GHRR01030989.1:526-1266(+)
MGVNEDPFADKPFNPFQHPLVWSLDEFFQHHRRPTADAVGQNGAAQGGGIASTVVRNQEHQAALKIMEQRRKLPPVLNDKALFTKAAPFGDRADGAYHAPSNRIGVYYSPASMTAASMLFEEFPQDPQAPRTRVGAGSPRQLSDIRSAHSSSRPLSPTGPASPTTAAATAAVRAYTPVHSSPKAQAAALTSQFPSLHPQLLQHQKPQSQGSCSSSMVATSCQMLGQLVRRVWWMPCFATSTTRSLA